MGGMPMSAVNRSAKADREEHFTREFVADAEAQQAREVFEAEATTRLNLQILLFLLTPDRSVCFPDVIR